MWSENLDPETVHLVVIGVEEIFPVPVIYCCLANYAYSHDCDDWVPDD